MKTKSLLAAGLLMAATAASSVAQTVYSVNAVGFVNVNCPSGFSLISNPLEASANTVSALFPSPPPGSVVFKFNSGSGAFSATTFAFGAWDSPSLTLVPGEGFFFKNPSGTTYTNTFVGNVKQGTLTTSLAAGFTLAASQVPQSGLVSTDLGLPPVAGDTVFQYSNLANAYTSSTFVFGSWSPTEPTIGVGEGFFVKKAAPASWTRNFSVNQ
jgi:hypothetical protein